jgi:hypothetical protein
MRKLVLNDLRRAFRPEFLNRLDETDHLSSLRTSDDLRNIVDIQLSASRAARAPRHRRSRSRQRQGLPRRNRLRSAVRRPPAQARHPAGTREPARAEDPRRPVSGRRHGARGRGERRARLRAQARGRAHGPERRWADRARVIAHRPQSAQSVPAPQTSVSEPSRPSSHSPLFAKRHVSSQVACGCCAG